MIFQYVNILHQMCCKNRSYYCGMFACLGNDYVYQALTFVVTFSSADQHLCGV